MECQNENISGMSLEFKKGASYVSIKPVPSKSMVFKEIPSYIYSSKIKLRHNYVKIVAR